MALGAFGLEGEIDKKAFIRKILEGGTTDPASLANRLTDKSFCKLAEAFGFGDLGGARTGEAGFAAKIVAAYKTRAFEAAVGDADNNMRLAMNFRREIAELAPGRRGRQLVQRARLQAAAAGDREGLRPAEPFGQIDIDQQRDVLLDKTGAHVRHRQATAFQDPAAVEKVINRFLARAQIEGGVDRQQPGAAALTLLRSMNDGGSQGLLNLLASPAG